MTVSTPHKDLNSTLTFVGRKNNSVAEHESLDWAPAQDSTLRTPTSAPVSCLEEKLNGINLFFQMAIENSKDVY